MAESKECCKFMYHALQEPHNFGIHYNPRFREYTVDCKGIGFLLTYCPSCGTLLPERLRKQWFDELEKVVQTEVSLTMDKRKIPVDFRSDQWWKKRDL